jgi:acetyl esterase
MGDAPAGAGPVTPDAQAQRLIDAVEIAGRPDFSELTPAEARIAFDRSIEALGGGREELAAVAEGTLAGAAGPRPIRLYRPLAGPTPAPALLWMHGGGFVFGSLASYDGFCRALANRSQCTIVALDYRLAPEHPFPAGADDCLAAWRDLHARAGELGLDRDRLAIGGDSAGGSLAAGLTLAARAGGAPVPRFALLVYPGVGMDTSTESHRRFASGYLLTRRTIDWCYRHYTGGGPPPRDVRFAPLVAPDLSGLPPCCIVVAGCDPLHDEGVAYARRLREAGVAVELLDYASTVHGFMLFPGVLDVATEAIAAAGERLARALAVREMRALSPVRP